MDFYENELIVDEDSFYTEDINKDFLLNMVDNDLVNLDGEDKSSLLEIRMKIESGEITSYGDYSY